MNNDGDEAQKLYDEQSDEWAKKQSANPAVQGLRDIVYNLASISSGSTVLFAGCGDGQECVKASSLGAIVTGIDVGTKNIEKALALGLKNTIHQVMNIQNLTFDDEQFDNVISILAIMYVQDIVEVLAGFKRVLKDNGQIIIAVPHPVIKMMRYNSKKDYFLRGKQYETWQGIKRFNYYRLFEDYVDAFTKAGLAITKLLEPKPATNHEEKVQYPHFAVFKLIKAR
ncbi:MAG: class I SAM-dependent methyltransferase [Candidatus Saccharibacteria bacterium]|nr:class I SAM-dependent methyltransferase [Candidatus Saccharibacteria bacterium]